MTTTLTARIEQLEIELADLKRQQQDQADQALLRVMAATVGDYTFTAAELAAHARMDGTLRAALGPCVRPRQVGRRLSRLAVKRALQNELIQCLNKFELRCLGRDEAGCIWQITESC
jgi:hypothetical protein